MKEKISIRALKILILISQSTRYENGKLFCYWIPKSSTEYITFEGESVAMDISGNGDASSLKSLEIKGLIKRPEGTPVCLKYAYLITEDGKSLISPLTKS